MACSTTTFEGTFEQEIMFCLADAFHERKIIHKKVALLSCKNNAAVLQLDNVSYEVNYKC